MGTTDRSWRALFLELALYVAVATLTVSSSLVHADSVPGKGIDLYGTLWFYWWIEECARHLQDPSFTDLFFYPWGKDIFAHTGNNFLDALVATPLHALLGPVAFYKWWVALVMVGNALALRPLARTLVSDRAAVVVACALYQVNPYFLHELSLGRVTQVFAWTLPLAFLGLLRLHRSWRWTVGTGVLVALTGYGYWFYAYFFALAAPWIVGVQLWQHRDDPAWIRRLLGRVVVAASVALLLVAPAVVAMASRGGPGTSPMLLDHGTAYLSYVPWLGGGPRMLERAVWSLGAVLWLVLGTGRVRWGGVALVGLLLALGPAPRVAGTHVSMPVYEAMLAGVPFFHRLLFPERAVVLVFLALSLGIGTVVARVGSRDPSRRWPTRLVAAALLILALVDLRPWLPLPRQPIRASALHGWIHEQGGAVMDLPMGGAQVAFVQQVFEPVPVFGGMGEASAPQWSPRHAERMTWPCVLTLQQVASGHPAPSPSPFDCSALTEQGVRWVVLHRDLLFRSLDGPPQQRRAGVSSVTLHLRELLGEPVGELGDEVAWHLGGAVTAPEELRPEHQDRTPPD